MVRHEDTMKNYWSPFIRYLKQLRKKAEQDKGLLEKASIKIRPKVRHSKKRDGKPFIFYMPSPFENQN